MHQIALEHLTTLEKREEMISRIFQGWDIELDISYPSDFRNAKILREFMDDICKACGVSPKWRTRLVLIIDELNNNAIEYGSKKGDSNTLSLFISPKEGKDFSLQAKVTDSGTWEYAKKAKDMEKLRREHENEDFTKHHSIRGRGLFLIISRLVDSLHFIDDSKWGLTVQIEKTLALDPEK